MNFARLIILCVVAVGLLTLVDIGVRVRQQRLNAFTKQFAIVPLYTNGTSGIMIADRIKNQPLWGKWNFDAGDSVNFFVEGNLVLSVASVKEGRSLTEVFFYGRDGKLSSVWKARENGTFYGRMFFDESGTKSEVWLSNAWHTVEMHTNGGDAQPGTVLDGTWRHLAFTNDVPSVQN